MSTSLDRCDEKKKKKSMARVEARGGKAGEVLLFVALLKFVRFHGH